MFAVFCVCLPLLLRCSDCAFVLCVCCLLLMFLRVLLMWVISVVVVCLCCCVLRVVFGLVCLFGCRVCVFVLYV